MKLDYLRAIVESDIEAIDLGYIVAAILNETEADDYEVEQLQTAEHECTLYIVRSADGEPLWIVDANGGGTMFYLADDWAEQIHQYAEQHGWGADEMPHVATAEERAGIPYDPSRAQRIEADAEAYQMRLWREIRGLEVEAE